MYFVIVNENVASMAHLTWNWPREPISRNNYLLTSYL